MTGFPSSLELHYTKRALFFFENFIEMHSFFKKKKQTKDQPNKKATKNSQLPLYHKH